MPDIRVVWLLLAALAFLHEPSSAAPRAPVAPRQARTADLPRIPEVHPDVAFRVVRELWFYYHWIPNNQPGMSPYGRYCEADEGDYCLEGDPESYCLRIRCHNDRQEREFVEKLARIAREHPDSPHAVLQAIYAAIRLERYDDAEALLEVCAPLDPWWCSLARGYVLHRTRRSAEAGGHLRRGLERAPPELRCRLEDVGFLLPHGAAERYEDVPCGEREDIHSHVWWLSDPYWVDGVDDRWAEHVARRFELLLHEERLAATKVSGGRGLEHTLGHEALAVRRGPADSWDFDRVVNRRYGVPEQVGYASRRAAANHFVPEALSLTGLDTSVTWRLEAELQDEGYTRRDGPARAAPAQIARFREGDSLVVALASDLGGGAGIVSEETHRPGGDPASAGGPNDAGPPPGRAFFVTSEGPQHVAALDPVPLSGRLAFAATLPERLQVLSLEVFSPAGGARHRQVLPPLEEDEVVLSDLLVFRPLGFDLPGTRTAAAGLMHGSVRVPRDLEVGIYWEGYGLPANEAVRVSVTLEGEEGGWLARLGQAVGVAEPPTDLTLSWTEETGEARPFAQSFTLDLGEVETGEIVLTLRVELDDGRTLSRSRTLEVVE